MVSLTNPLRNFKRTDLRLSRFLAVSRGIIFYYLFYSNDGTVLVKLMSIMTKQVKL